EARHVLLDPVPLAGDEKPEFLQLEGRVGAGRQHTALAAGLALLLQSALDPPLIRPLLAQRLRGDRGAAGRARPRGTAADPKAAPFLRAQEALAIIVEGALDR